MTPLLPMNTLLQVEHLHGQQLSLGSKRKVRRNKGKKRRVHAFLSCDDNALEEMFRPGAPPDADSSSSSSQGVALGAVQLWAARNFSLAYHFEVPHRQGL